MFLHKCPKPSCGFAQYLFESVGEFYALAFGGDLVEAVCQFDYVVIMPMLRMV